MDPKPLTIGRVARLAGVNVETVRYYQRRGLIEEPDKPVSGFRCYPKATVARIQFIKRAQRLGFSLGEIHELLNLGDGHCEDVAHLARRKRAQIDRQIRDLKAMQGALQQLIAACQGQGNEVRCPIVEALTNPDGPQQGAQRPRKGVAPFPRSPQVAPRTKP